MRQTSCSIDGERWQRSSAWSSSANSKTATLGDICQYSEQSKHPCIATPYKGRKKGRVKKTLRGGQSQCSTDKYQEIKANEPWFLMSHLPQNWNNKPKKLLNYAPNKNAN